MVPFTAANSLASMGPFNSIMPFASVWSLFTYIGSLSFTFTSVRLPTGGGGGQGWSAPAVQQVRLESDL